MDDTPKNDAYDEKIAPLMSEIIALCKQHDIAMAASFELDPRHDVEDDWLFCSTVLPDEAKGPLIPRLSKVIHRAKDGIAVSLSSITTRAADGIEKTQHIAHID